MMSSLKNPLYNGLYSNITFKKVMVVVCSVLLLINSVGMAVADNPFFNQTIRTAPTTPNANQPLINQQLYGFDGQLTDPESGYQFLGRGYHRAYNPVTRRFMSQDSMSPFSKGGFNGYIFASNNPIMHQDPSGHMSTNFWINIGAILGAIVGAVLAPFTGGSTAVIAAGEVAAAAGATSGALGAAGAATHNSGLQKASLGLGIAGAAIDAVNIIGSGAKLVASSVNSASVVTSDSRGISTIIGDASEKIDTTATAASTSMSTTVGENVVKDSDTGTGLLASNNISTEIHAKISIIDSQYIFGTRPQELTTLDDYVDLGKKIALRGVDDWRGSPLDMQHMHRGLIIWGEGMTQEERDVIGEGNFFRYFKNKEMISLNGARKYANAIKLDQIENANTILQKSNNWHSYVSLYNKDRIYPEMPTF